MTMKLKISDSVGDEFATEHEQDLGGIVGGIAHASLIEHLCKNVPLPGDEIGERRFLKQAEPALLKWLTKMRVAERLAGCDDETYSSISANFHHADLMDTLVYAKGGKH